MLAHRRLTDPERRERAPSLPPLTSLRFAAALLVVCAHWDVSRGHVPSMFGAAGVEFFFVLSGFILTHVYRTGFTSGNALAAVRAFWLARFARVYPLHVLTLLAVCLLGLVAIRPPFYGIALGAQLTLLQSWIPVDNVPFAFNGPAWTLSDEAFFYAVFPFALQRLIRARLSIVHYGCIAAAIWLLACCFDLSVDAAQPAMQWLVYVFPLPRLADFICGMILALAFAQADVRLSAARATILECASIATVIFGIAISPSLPPAYGFASCLVPAWMGLIFIFAVQRGALSQLLRARPLVALGEASFALYMVHHIVMDRLTGCGALATALGVALAIHHWIEVPARKVIRARTPGLRLREPV